MLIAGTHTESPTSVLLSPRLRVVAAGTTCFLTLSVLALPAVAATLPDQGGVALDYGAQELETVSFAEPISSDRDGYSVVRFSAVSWPLDPSTPRGQGFGPRPGGGFHNGMDWFAPAGTPVHSVAEGVVVGVNSMDGSLGTHVIVAHRIDGQTWLTLYAHMQTGSVPVAEGQTVHLGDVLGGVGATGSATAVHLHFAVMTPGYSFVDPAAWLRTHVNE